MAAHTRIRVRALVAAIAVAAIVAPSCNSPGPCFGVGVGTRLGITIVDYYTGNPNYPQDERGSGAPGGCVFGFDVVQGQELVATVVSTSGAGSDSCDVAVPAFQPFGAWSWQGGEQNTGGNTDVFDARYSATSSDCEGQVAVYAVAASETQDVFKAPVVGQLPPVVMERDFMGGQALGDAGAATCPTSCTGTFVVSLRRLN
jgi:hypothetical protein